MLGMNFWNRSGTRQDFAPHWAAGGEAPIGIVELHQHNLALLKDAMPGTLACQARLVPEPDHPHDRFAVRVEIGGRSVGYLPASHAVAYREALARHNLAGEPVWCASRILGGFDEGQAFRPFSVSLDLAWPLRLARPGSEPAAAAGLPERRAAGGDPFLWLLALVSLASGQWPIPDETRAA